MVSHQSILIKRNGNVLRSRMKHSNSITVELLSQRLKACRGELNVSGEILCRFSGWTYFTGTILNASRYSLMEYENELITRQCAGCSKIWVAGASEHSSPLKYCGKTASRRTPLAKTCVLE